MSEQNAMREHEDFMAVEKMRKALEKRNAGIEAFEPIIPFDHADLMQCHKEEKATPKSAYHMVPILDKDGLLDCYHLIRTIEAHNNKPMDSAKQHALKKIAFGGHRGHKDEIIDISEAIGTLTKYKEWLERNNGK